MPSALIIGAARGLGLALTTTFQSQSYTVFATTRSNMPPQEVDTGLVRWLTQIDLSSPSCGTDLASALKAQHLKEPVDVVVITAGYFGLESFEDMDWEGQVKMYTLSAIAPGFLVRGLVEGGLLREGKEGKEGEGAKVILVGSESGSVGLRHEKEGGGNYGHHGSKAAVNMVGKLLGLDLMGRGIVVGVVHVSHPLPSSLRDCLREHSLAANAELAGLHADGDDERGGIR